jgi:hypothetical protein
LPDQYTQIAIPTYAEYVKDNEAVIDLLIVRMRRKGIELSEQEAWQYISWCQRSLVLNLEALSGTKGSESIRYLTAEIAEAAAHHFQGWKLGKLMPPNGPRFDSPEDHATKMEGTNYMPAVEAISDRNKFSGYL